jgi:hypothetical protein
MKNRKISDIYGWYKDDDPNCQTSGFNVCSYISNTEEGIAGEFEDLNIYIDDRNKIFIKCRLGKEFAKQVLCKLIDEAEEVE